MPNARTHLSDAELSAFVLGKLPDPADGAVATHITECGECRARAVAVPPGDTFVALLASAGTQVAAARASASTPPPDSSPGGNVTQVWTGPRAADVAAADIAAADATTAGLAAHPRYRLVRPLGAGGMGDVWLAEHAVMGRPVALKVIRPEFLARPGAVERFRREVRAVAALHHPNIVTAFDADEAGGTHFLVMEYVAGETLADVVARGPLPVADACRAARDAARGLAHAHAASLIHRDVKPSNLIRAAGGAVKVLDFGLVGAGAGGVVELTAENVVMGTPDYIAPEQATDARTADARSDVYSLGCTLYHLLAGRVPFPADTTLKKLDAHRDRARTPKPVAGIPGKLARVLARMTAKNPAMRYQTAEAAADALDPFCVTLDTDVPTVVSPAPPQPRSRSRHRFALAAGLLFALCAVAAGGVAYKVHRDNQIITVETDDPNIEVVMRRNGEVVRIVDTKTKQAWELDTKHMRLKPDGGELSIDLPGEGPLVIRRNGDVAVVIRREPAAPPATDAVRPIPPAGPIQLDTEAHINALALSPDGTRALAGGDDAKVFVWDPATGRTTRRFPERHSEYVLHAAWSPDGRRAVSGDSKGGVVVWDATDGKVLYNFPWDGSEWAGVMAVGFFPDGKRVWACRQKRLTVWDAKSGKEVLTIDPPDGTPFHHAALSLAGDRFLTADNGAARVWDATTGKAGLKLTSGFAVWVNRVAFAPDGKRAATGDNGGRVYVWDLSDGTQVWSEQAYTVEVWALIFTPDGKRLVTGPNGSRGNTLRVWATADGRPLADLPGMTNTHEPALTPDGRRLLAGGGKGVVRVFDLPAPKKP